MPKIPKDRKAEELKRMQQLLATMANELDRVAAQLKKAVVVINGVTGQCIAMSEDPDDLPF